MFRGGADLPALEGTIALLAAVIAGRAALAWAIEALSYRASAGVKSQLRRDLLRRSVELGPRWLATRRAGELTTLTTVGVDALDAYFARYLPQVVLAVVIPLAVVARLLAADPLSAAIIIVTLPLIPLFMALVGATTADRTRRRWRELARLSHHFLDVVAGLPTLRTFGRAKAQAKTVGEVTDAYRRATLGTLRLAFLSALVLELLATFSVALVAVAIGLRLEGGTSACGPACSSWCSRRRPTCRCASSRCTITRARTASPLPRTCSTCWTPPDAAGARQRGLLSRVKRTRGRARPRGGRVRVEDVRVCHPGRSQPAPAGADFAFGAGEVVALPGRAEAGSRP